LASSSGSEPVVRTFELAQNNLRKRTEGRVADGDLGIQRLAGAGQDDALEKRRAGGDEVEDDHENQQSGADDQEFASPASRLTGWVKIQVLRLT